MGQHPASCLVTVYCTSVPPFERQYAMVDAGCTLYAFSRAICGVSEKHPKKKEEKRPALEPVRWSAVLIV